MGEPDPSVLLTVHPSAARVGGVLQSATMIRPIVKYGDAVLHRTAAEVAHVTHETLALVDDMVDTMYAAPGVGLAAPQIGVSQRIFVADASSGRREDALIVMINPVVVEREGVQSETEGCLSVPGLEATVARPARLVLRGLDRDGTTREIAGTGLLARVFQHELDHLDGSLFLDRLHGIKRDLLLRKIAKRRRAGDW